MNQLNECVMALAGLTALWVLWCFFFREQRVDLYREKLFALRDELFDMAADGELKFNHTSYYELRLVLNGMLRFAHRANLIGLIVAVLRSRLRKGTPSSFVKWESALKELPIKTQSHLRSLHQQMLKAFMLHLFTGSIILILLLGPSLIWVFSIALCGRVLRGWARFNFRRGFDRAVAKVARQAGAQAFEVDAYYSGREAQAQIEELQAV